VVTKKEDPITKPVVTKKEDPIKQQPSTIIKPEEWKLNVKPKVEEKKIEKA